MFNLQQRIRLKNPAAPEWASISVGFWIHFEEMGERRDSSQILSFVCVCATKVVGQFCSVTNTFMRQVKNLPHVEIRFESHVSC